MPALLKDNYNYLLKRLLVFQQRFIRLWAPGLITNRRIVLTISPVQLPSWIFIPTAEDPGKITQNVGTSPSRSFSLPPTF